MLRKLLISVLSVVAAVSYAQKVQKVTATYAYHAPENVSLEQAKATALDRAKIQAIAAEFGTIVSQRNSTRIENRNGESAVDFLSIGGSDVRGEWIETIDEPKYEIAYEQGVLVVKVSVKGRIREIVSAGIDISTRILRNGTEDRFESEEFRSGDDLYLSFISPVDGYLAVYLVDAEQRAYCLLPYRSQGDGIYKVAANRRYLFFNIKEAEAHERQYVDEYTMTCERSLEQNQIYIVFSPQPFAKAADNATVELLPRELGYEDFQKWLAALRKRDYQIILNIRQIKIQQ